MVTRQVLRTFSRGTLVVSASLFAASCTTVGPSSGVLVPSTPEGVTLVEVMRDLPISQPQVLWVRPGDPEGRTLLISDRDPAGKSLCTGECAKEFPPLAAAANARAFGDWSVIRRQDGTRQWAYQGHALYTWTKEKLPGEVATNVGLTETANQKFAENEVKAGDLMPPEGWRVARFEPWASLVLPAGIDARLVLSLQAVALTNEEGRTLYVFDGDAQQDGQFCVAEGCGHRWIPVQAPALAKGIGGFSVVTRADGTAQWAYLGKPLYTYEGDLLPGDAHGVGIDKRWTAAQVSVNFRPEGVEVRTLDGYGDVLTHNGMTLYGGYLFEKRWGGRNLRDTFTNDYWKGKALGAQACVDERCLEDWHPFLAPPDAKAHGFWEPIKRPDGSLQWAYKGYALYTYSGDKAPGDHYGQATYAFEPVAGPGFDVKRVSFLHEISQTPAGVGIYWNVAKP